MREILFRGKRFDNGKWVEGLLWKKKYDTPKLFMSYFPNKDDDEYVVVIDPETVGQYTGLKDTNGKKIFEGDILGDWGEDEKGKECLCYMGVVDYWEREGKYVLTDKNGYCNDWTFEEEGKPENWEKLIILGNIHDNPELLQEE